LFWQHRFTITIARNSATSDGTPTPENVNVNVSVSRPFILHRISGAGTNLKAGGGTRLAQAPENVL